MKNNVGKNQLRGLSKQKLIDLFQKQGDELAAAKTKRKALEEKLADEMIDLRVAGSLAEEARKLSKIFEDAQRQADTYLK